MGRFIPALTTLFLLSATGAIAVDVSDLGVTPGLTAPAYNDIGNELLNKGDYKGARRYLDAAIRVRPDFWPAHFNHALTFYMQKNWKAALQDLNRTIKLQPAFFEASWRRALVYLNMKDYSAALRDLNVLAEVTVKVANPGEYAIVVNQRAWLRATCPDASFRNAGLAIADAKRACELSKWNRSGYIDTLAAAYAEAGDFDSAVRYEEQAMAVNKSEPGNRAQDLAIAIGRPMRDAEKKELASQASQSLQGFTQHLALYKQHRPFRE